MLASLVLWKTHHRICFIVFKSRGHNICVLDLPHGYNNIVNQLAKKAKVMAWSLFPIMVLFETSSRFNYICTNIQAECEIFLFGLAILQCMKMKHVRTFGDSSLTIQVVGVFSCFEGSSIAYFDKFFSIITHLAEFSNPWHEIVRLTCWLIYRSIRLWCRWMQFSRQTKADAKLKAVLVCQTSQARLGRIARWKAKSVCFVLW